MTKNGSVRINAIGFNTIQSNLQFYRTQGISDVLAGDAFSGIVYSKAHKTSPEAEFQPSVYQTATETIDRTMFAALTSTQLLQPRDTPQQLLGQLDSTVTRLDVSVPIAAVLSTLLFFMIICTLALIIHMQHSTSILTEEPIDLLGRTLLLLRSEVIDFATRLQLEHTTGEKLIDCVKKEYTVAESSC